MNELREYVDTLFQHQRLTDETKDLKEEIISNMTAKRDDFISQGMDEAAAAQKAKESLLSVDSFVSGSQLTYTRRYYTDCLQTALLYCTVSAILALPLLFTRHGLVCITGLLTAVVLGIVYIAYRRADADDIAYLSISKSERRRKLTWILWSIFFIVYEGMMAALTFGSNIFFGYPLNISGPSQLADIVGRFYAPLLTIVIPITIGSFTKLLVKNEKRFEDE